MARDDGAVRAAAAPRADLGSRDPGPNTPGPDDPAQAIRGYRGARRRLVARVAIGATSRSAGALSTGAWASGLMLALVATSALVAGAFSLAAP